METSPGTDLGVGRWKILVPERQRGGEDRRERSKRKRKRLKKTGGEVREKLGVNGG